MPPAISNPEGHYEDMLLVGLHDRLLRLNGTDWRFHDQGELDPAPRLDLLQRYIEHRSATSKGPWGAKDPRACLFLPAWRQVLGEQGRYLVLLRHWSGSVQSLYRRHSEALAVGEGSAELHTGFWRDPELAARMWLAYHRRILSLLEEERDRCLVVTQQALLAGLPVIEKVNARFGLVLDESTPSPIRHSLSHDRIDVGIRERLPASLLEELENTWQRLLANADHCVEKEAPTWVSLAESNAISSALLERAAAYSSESKPDKAPISDSRLVSQLALLAEQPDLPLDVVHWVERIKQEARFVPECWEHLARAQLARGDALGAEAHLARVLLCGKSQPYLFLLLGTCREAELDDEGAEHYYRQAITRNDANAIFHVRLCRLWLAQGHYARAEDHLRQALARYPDKPALVQALAECLDQQGATPLAIALLESQEHATSGMQQQLASLHMKQAPERVQNIQSERLAQAARLSATQESVFQALASITSPEAREDLAQRIAAVWQRLGIDDPNNL